MKSLVHTEELCSRNVPLEYAPGAKSLVCIGLYTFLGEVFSEKTQHTLKMADANEHTLFQ